MSHPADRVIVTLRSLPRVVADPAHSAAIHSKCRSAFAKQARKDDAVLAPIATAAACVGYAWHVVRLALSLAQVPRS